MLVGLLSQRKNQSLYRPRRSRKLLDPAYKGASGYNMTGMPAIFPEEVPVWGPFDVHGFQMVGSMDVTLKFDSFWGKANDPDRFSVKAMRLNQQKVVGRAFLFLATL